MARKRKPYKTGPTKEKAICVRMEKDLYDALTKEADRTERTPPAMARLILKKHFNLRFHPEDA